MIYYSEHNLLFFDILKNGSTGFRKLFELVLGKEDGFLQYHQHDNSLFFITPPVLYATVVRNPYERLLTQFYHVNKKQLWTTFRYTVHYPFFRKWAKEFCSNEYKENDGHLYTQTQFLKFYENPLEYKIFKIEKLFAHELFFFLDLTAAQKAQIDNEYSKIIKELQGNLHHATNSIKQGTWQSYYDAETIEMCNKYYKCDFKAFDYEIIKPEEFEQKSFHSSQEGWLTTSDNKLRLI
jgi:hypothetical protein